MTAIVFGSAEAQAIAAENRIISSLEYEAYSNAQYDWWVDPFELTKAQKATVRRLISQGHWEKEDLHIGYQAMVRPNETERVRIAAEQAAGGGL